MESLAKHVRTVVLIPFTVISVVLMSGCAAITAEPSLYYDDIVQAGKGAKSEYVREILQDGKITSDEYRDSQQQNLGCLKAAGVAAALVDTGAGYSQLQTSTEDETALFEIMSQCSDEWVDQIEALYVSELTNPNKGDADGLIAACLVRKKLAPEGFTASDYRELVQDRSTEVSGSDFGSGEHSTEIEASGPVLLPGGATLDDPPAEACLLNPGR